MRFLSIILLFLIYSNNTQSQDIDLLGLADMTLSNSTYGADEPCNISVYTSIYVDGEADTLVHHGASQTEMKLDHIEHIEKDLESENIFHIKEVGKHIREKHVINENGQIVRIYNDWFKDGVRSDMSSIHDLDYDRKGRVIEMLTTLYDGKKETKLKMSYDENGLPLDCSYNLISKINFIRSQIGDTIRYVQKTEIDEEFVAMVKEEAPEMPEEEIRVQYMQMFGGDLEWQDIVLSPDGMYHIYLCSQVPGEEAQISAVIKRDSELRLVSKQVGEMAGLKTTLSYDELGRVSASKRGEEDPITNHYNQEGAPLVFSENGYVFNEYNYDAMGRVKSVVVLSRDQPGKVLTLIEFDYVE